jgi:hypothetical protein
MIKQNTRVQWVLSKGRIRSLIRLYGLYKDRPRHSFVPKSDRNIAMKSQILQLNPRKTEEEEERKKNEEEEVAWITLYMQA